MKKVCGVTVINLNYMAILLIRIDLHLDLRIKLKKNIRKYWDRIQYATGVNFDTGYLEVDGKRVNNAAISFGLSLPLENTYSALNISYSYGQKGSISNNLIKENYHKISLNLSLDGIWFIKRKID